MLMKFFLFQNLAYFANLFKIKSGRVHVEKEIAGKKSLLKVLADGDFFGEMSFLDNKTNASVIAASEVVVFQLSKENLRKLLLVSIFLFYCICVCCCLFVYVHFHVYLFIILFSIHSCF